MDYSPIQICYGGYRFRSKLEAKWATFLDYLKIEYEYEPRIFNLSNGKGYLPDFWLKKQDIFLEIKPEKQLSQADFDKITLFSSDPNYRANLVVLFGEPDIWQSHYYLYQGEAHYPVSWRWDYEEGAALLLKEDHWGDPDHPKIYGAVEYSHDFDYVRLDT